MGYRRFDSLCTNSYDKYKSEVKICMKFVIVSPRQQWGGAIALHALCKYLSEMGHDAKIFYCGLHYYDKQKPMQFWLRMLKSDVKETAKLILAYAGNERFEKVYKNPPVRGCRRKYLPFVGEDTIVVYPESIYGNFLHAKKTVRWLLYHHPFSENPQAAFGDDALFIAYREDFNDEKLNPAGHIVSVSYFDLETYRQYNFGERSGNCYVIRKGRNRPDLPKEFDGPILDDLPEKNIVEAFNRCEYCISYDTQTAYSGIAALCGCVSIVVPEPGKGKSDYLSSKENCFFGVAYGFSEEELLFARETRHRVKELSEEANQKGKESAQRFAEICKAYFYER